MRDARFVGLMDSRVAKGALAKGRSSSKSLQVVCRRSAALQLATGLQPGWCFAPTRLNVADDPTRRVRLRGRARISLLSLLEASDLKILHACQLKRFAANWVRLVLLLALTVKTEAAPIWILDFSVDSHAASVFGQIGPVDQGSFAMEPSTALERERAARRSSVNLVATRVVRTDTLKKRSVLLADFRAWLHEAHGIMLAVLLTAKPPDPEEICRLLVMYGQEMYAAGKAYGKFAETINAVASYRPAIKKQLTGAWDLCFAWLADEPTQHHPALPLSVLLAMMSLALLWGWPVEASLFGLAWAGILRIGEVLMAKRDDLILPRDAAPGDPERVRRAGRWVSSKVMDVYIQEVMYTTFTEQMPASAKQKIQQLASAFPRILDQALIFLRAAIPPNTWLRLYQTEDTEEHGEARGNVGRNTSFCPSDGDGTAGDGQPSHRR
eukprot:s1965_g17.t1